MDGLQYLASFGLVIALLLGVLYGLRRLQNVQAFGRKAARLQVVDSIALGARHKIALVRCDERELLLGITAHEITLLQAQPAQPSGEGTQP